MVHNAVEAKALMKTIVGHTVNRANILGAYVIGFEEAITEYSKKLLMKITE